MTTPHPLTTSDLVQILTGDAQHIRVLKERQQSEITKVAEEMPSNCLILLPEAVRRVLISLLKREIVPEQAQAWASFVKRGYIPTGRDAISPILITYDANREDEIVEAIARLDELGDLLDGTLDDDEIRQLLEQLDK